MVTQKRYDVIVIGGGSAGCAAATRLSEDPARKVLLLEAGEDPQPIPEMVSTGAGRTRLLLESDYVLMYPTQRKADGSTFYALSGRVMGGGSSVNSLVAPRPPKHDFDTWERLGNPGWSYEDVLPAFKRLETDADFPDSPIHGADGPVHVERLFRLDQPMPAPIRAFIDAAVSKGLPICPDLNGPSPLGVSVFPSNVKDDYRQSTAATYLAMARGRPNLDIVAEAPVVSLKIQSGKVEEVLYQKDGETRSAAGDQIVLSAGVYHSPQILMLSGIGPNKELERLGIKVTHPLDGVGENYQDHATLSMTYEELTRPNEEWVWPRFNLLIKSSPEQPCGNIHIFMWPPTEVAGLKRMMRFSLHLLEQRARGRVYLKNPDPAELPEIDSVLLEHPKDMEAMLSAMEFVSDLVQDDLLKGFYGRLIQPGPREEWENFALTTHGTYHHGVGTCMMGPASNSTAVVDEKLRVHGIHNLRVADASIMPTITHSNTNLASIMIGERVSDFIKEVN